MKIRLGLISVATGTLLLAAVSGCGDNGANSPPTPPARTSPSAPTTSASPTSLSDAATADATSVLHHYFGLLDRLRQDPSVSLRELATVAAGTQLSAQKHLVSAERARSLRQTGATRIRDEQVQSVNLDNSDPTAGRVPTVEIDVCWDVSQADLVNKRGESVVSPNRAERGWTRYTLTNHRWTSNPSDGWRVTTSRDLKQSPCAAS